MLCNSVTVVYIFFYIVRACFVNKHNKQRLIQQHAKCKNALIKSKIENNESI